MTVFFLIIREGIEFSILLLLLTGVYREYKKPLLVFAAAVIAAGALLTGLNYPLPGFLKSAYTGFLFYSFIMLLLLSFVSDNRVVYPLIAVLLLFFISSAELASVILDKAALRGSSVLIFALAGMLVIAGIFWAARRFLANFDLTKFLGTDGVFVFLAAFCFVFGGLNEFDHASIITVLQQGLHALFSSFIPFMKGVLLIPDGGTIVTEFDGLFDYFSSQRVAMAMTACILFLPPLAVFIRLLLSPEPDTEVVEKKSARRKVISLYRDDLLRKGTPLLFALLVSIVLLHSANLAARPTYDPEPVPVIADGEVITVPLKDRLGDVADGKMRKYSFLHQGETFRFIVIMRPDGEVTAALDACEVCPPRGYVQRGGHVICTYCNTPIPLSSLGQPGGCNPIPVRSRTAGDSLVLSKGDIVSAYKKEAGKESGSVLR